MLRKLAFALALAAGAALPLAGSAEAVGQGASYARAALTQTSPIVDAQYYADGQWDDGHHGYRMHHGYSWHHGYGWHDDHHGMHHGYGCASRLWLGSRPSWLA